MDKKIKNKRNTKRVKRQAYIFIGMVVIALIIVFSTLYFAYVEYSNNNLKFPVGAITDIHLWGHINGQPEYDVNSYMAYIATTKQQQVQGFMNVSNLGYGSMIFIFNNQTEHCFWDKNTQFNLTLAWINVTQKDGYNVQGQNYEQEYFGKITAISHLTAYNTTPICADSNMAWEINANNNITIGAGDTINVIR